MRKRETIDDVFAKVINPTPQFTALYLIHKIKAARKQKRKSAHLIDELSVVIWGMNK